MDPRLRLGHVKIKAHSLCPFDKEVIKDNSRVSWILRGLSLNKVICGATFSMVETNKEHTNINPPGEARLESSYCKVA